MAESHASSDDFSTGTWNLVKSSKTCWRRGWRTHDRRHLAAYRRAIGKLVPAAQQLSLNNMSKKTGKRDFTFVISQGAGQC